MFKKDDFSKKYELKKELNMAPDSLANTTKIHEAKVKPEKKISVAVKVVKKKNLSDKQLKQIHLETAISQSVSHPNIVKFVEAIETATKIYIVNDFISGRNLYNVMKPLTPDGLREEKAGPIVLQLARALQHLHENHIVHRSLKPGNVLIQDNGVVKLTGFSSAMSTKRKLTGVAGVVFYMAPEMLLRQPYTTEPDLWSLGVLTFFMLGGFVPFFHKETVHLCEKVVDFDYSFEDDRWSLVSDDGKKMIQKLLCPKDRRMSAAELQEDAWVKKNGSLPEEILSEEEQKKNKETMNLLKDVFSTLKVVGQFTGATSEVEDEKGDDTEEAKLVDENDAFTSMEDFDIFFSTRVPVETNKTNLEAKKLL